MSISMKLLTPSGVNASVETFTFPGGEHHLRGFPDLPHPAITWLADVRGADPNDLVKAALLADVADGRGDDFVLLLPYAPAARADRGTPFGARVYADIINTMGAERVVVLDPHSPVVTHLLDRVVVADHAPLVERALNSSGYEYDAVIAPDKGAGDRTERVAEQLGVDLYKADKRRDFETGRILSVEMNEDLPKSGRYLVVDDICDGGGTFMGLADAIGLPREQLGLWVTHGIFSGNAHLLRNHYGRIFTTDSHPGHNRADVATTIVPTFVHMLAHVPTPKRQ
ncbi:hypothetical protein [Mycobacterium phage WXIN]|nr:hypothetical protein [Mycobacterium phage WXIN]